MLQTTIPRIPSEVLSQSWHDDCRQRLIDHLQDLKAGVEPVTDVKALVVGNGRIGKTQICRRLGGQEYDDRVSSTHGIVVTQASLPVPDQQNATLNLWDFGGQDLYHGTHALFLKSRAIFLLVWTPKAETLGEYEYGGMRFRNQPLPYWVEYVRHSAGPKCPIVLIQNQCDGSVDEIPYAPVDAELLSPFYHQQVHYSAKENRKRGTLDDALMAAVQHLRGQEGIVTIGKGRMRVRKQLQEWLDQDAQREPEQRQHRTLTQDQFCQLCDVEKDVSSPDSLLDYLHNAGIVFYRKELFRDEIVLDQSWALNAIYTVFNRQQCYRQLITLKGRFTRSLLDVLVWKDYSAAEQALFLSLMESCGICFKIRAQDEKKQIEAEYAAPDLLPSREEVAKDFAGRWDESGPRAECVWQFEFLNAALIRSIVSHVGQQAGPQAVYWKYGVLFFDAKTRSHAVVQQAMDDDRRGRIILQTQGDRRQELLEAVSKWIEEQIRRFGTSPLAVEGKPFEKDREPADETLTRAPAIQIADPPQTRLQTCVSYAWKDELSHEPARAGKVDEFCAKLKSKGREVLRDTTHVSLGDRLSSFLRRIGQGDRVYIFLSDAYLKSPHCMYELLLIWQTSGDDPEVFRKRILIHTVPGTEIRTIPARLKYSIYWKQQREEIRKLIDECGTGELGETDLKNFKRIQDFSHHVNEMLAQIADVLQPATFDEFIDQALAD